jgi:predicted transcriptional regulator
MSDKQMAAAVLDKMPETATLEEIREELAILAALQRGRADIEAGRTVSHEDVKQRSAAWNSK